MAESANYASFAFPLGVNEFEKAGFTPMPSEVVRPPRVAESVVHMECILSGHHEVSNLLS
jgi:flavin reductase (DIM6/NTAB) family NADH-FMN oxidoreductase RutF